MAGLAASQGHTVTVVEAGSAPLGGQLTPNVGALTTGWYEEAGVDLRVQTPVRSVAGGEVVLDGGDVLQADVALAAVGVRPATEWLPADVPRTARGAIPVDRSGRARGAAPGLWAVGDCADIIIDSGVVLPGVDSGAVP
jgi:NADPH-dependent 2,4-dienoyl-CoA reductase/sulfur reductase-like enzyme